MAESKKELKVKEESKRKKKKQLKTLKILNYLKIKIMASNIIIKIMANLDSILKSSDITLPTEVHLVKTMVFPVVMYGCESWTIKKAEHQRIDAFELW